jgi:hypothetical protein
VFKALATLTGVERLAFGWHYNAQIEVGDKEIGALFRVEGSAGTSLHAMQFVEAELVAVREAAGSGSQLQSVHR